MINIHTKLETARDLKKQEKYLDSYNLFKEVIDLSPNIDNSVKREFSDILNIISTKFQHESFSIVERLSQQGDILASGRLARYYRDGVGCKKNIEEAIRLYSLGSDQYQWMKVELLELMLHNSSFGQIKQITNVDKIFDRADRKILKHEVLIENDILKCFLDEKVRIDLILYCDGNVIERKFIFDDNYSFKLNKSGIYRVSGRVRNSNTYFESKNVQYYTEKDKQEFTSFLSSETKKISFDYYYLNYPFNDFVLTNIDKLSLDKKLHGYNYGNNYLYTTGKKIEDYKQAQTIFLSGYYHDKDQLIFGEKDFSNNISKKNYSLSNKVGCFDSISINKKNKLLTLNTDVFGLSKIYYYTDQNNNFVVSNRYHLLVICLSQLGIRLNFDQEKLSCMLSTSYGMLTDQFSDNKCLLSGTNLLPIDHQIQIDYSGNLVIQELNVLKCAENDISNETYFKMIKETESELQNNLNSYFNSLHFKNYYSDLTGGVDSRLVFSLLSLNEKNSERVKLLSGGAINDVKCAQSIAQRFNYKFGKTLAKFFNDKFNKTLTNFTEQEYTNLIMSYELGTAFDHSTLFYPKKLDGTLHITGCAGEACTRPYMSKRFFNVTSGCSKHDLINIYYQNIANYICLSSDRVEQALNSLFSNISDTTLYQKCEDFLINRTRYHFDPHLKISFSDAVATPLLSINGYKTLRMTLTKFNSYKFVFDLLNSISSQVATCEYESLKDNISLALFSNNESNLKNCSESLSDDYINYANNNDSTYVLKNGSTINSNQLQNTNLDIYGYCLNQLNNYLKIMLKDNIINSHDGIDLWHLIQNCKNKTYRYSNPIILGMFKKFTSIVVINSIINHHSNIQYEFKEKQVKKYTYRNDTFIEL